VIILLGIIGGSGVYEITELADSKEDITVDTEYGSVVVTMLNIESKKVAFISRHHKGHKTPPHMINYKANIQALANCGVDQIISTNAVGSINMEMPPGSIVLPDDFLDFTVLRDRTFYDNEVHHIDMSEPYCPRLREAILENGEDEKIIPHGTYVCTEGPRFETPAEIKMFKIIGGDLVGMTGLSEAVLAREKGICYETICVVSNFGTSISPDKLSFEEVAEIMEEKKHALLGLIHRTILSLDDDYDCDCHHALE
jgi:5'-methylthioadenosine phosphorylase